MIPTAPVLFTPSISVRKAAARFAVPVNGCNSWIEFFHGGSTMSRARSLYAKYFAA